MRISKFLISGIVELQQKKGHRIQIQTLKVRKYTILHLSLPWENEKKKKNPKLLIINKIFKNVLQFMVSQMSRKTKVTNEKN